MNDATCIDDDDDDDSDDPSCLAMLFPVFHPIVVRPMSIQSSCMDMAPTMSLGGLDEFTYTCCGSCCGRGKLFRSGLS